MTTPKDFFTWVAAMAALLVSTISLLALWFEYIDQLFGEVDMYGYGYNSWITGNMAALIVIFPLCVWLLRIVHNDIRKDPTKKDIWVRRWLGMAAVFVSGFVIVVDLITLISTFLQGEELTLSFVGKVFSVLIVMGSVLYYFIHELKGTWEHKKRASEMIALAVSAVVVATILGAFFIIGSPRTQRLMQYDQQKVSDLQGIQSNVLSYYQQMGTVPESLEQLKDPLSWFVVPQDPQAKEGEGFNYTYEKRSATSFVLCALFNTDRAELATDNMPRASTLYSGYPSDPSFEYWQHGKGSHCFERVIDPKKYPVHVPVKM